MNCAISGEVPSEPVISLKSGHVYEKALIHKAIEQTGRCPVTGEDLEKTDLLEVKGNPIVRPRPPSATSVPGLIKVFQSEWDALMTETYTLKEHLHATRQQLAKQMYEHDAACRVIARLIKERDEARAALENVRENVSARPQGSAMDVDDRSDTAWNSVVEQMSTTAKGLSKPRKKRVKALVAAATTADVVGQFRRQSTHPLHSASKPGILCVDINASQDDKILTGGADGTAIVFTKSTGKIAATLKGHRKKVVDVQWHPNQDVIFTASADHTASIWTASRGSYKAAHTLRDHTAEVVACSVHPSGTYLVTASGDASWNFYDTNQGTLLQHVEDGKSPYTCAQFHPDGLILGVGTKDSVVQIFDVKERKNVCNFSDGHSKGITSLCFSENGYYLASGDGRGTIKLWDLRKLQSFETISPDQNGAASALRFDLSGAYLAAGSSSNSVRVFSTKQWKTVNTFDDHSGSVTGLAWGANAGYLASTSMDRSLKLFSA